MIDAMKTDSDANEAERQRKLAIEIGNTLAINRFNELCPLISSPYPAVRRASASAAAKLIGFSPDLRKAYWLNLHTAAVKEQFPQTLQYQLKTLLLCADQMIGDTLSDIEDIARDASRKPYVRDAANEVVAAVQRAQREAEARRHHWCTRCKRRISDEQAAVTMKKYGKPYCHHCFDERQIEDRNFESEVESAKKLRTTDEVAVQSQGEKRIGDWLAARKIEYVYDERYRIAGDVSLRPDFYLPEFDLYIEYWGMKTHDYLARKSEKRFLYQRAGKKLISLDWRDLPRLESKLKLKLSRYIRL